VLDLGLDIFDRAHVHDRTRYVLGVIGGHKRAVAAAILVGTFLIAPQAARASTLTPPNTLTVNDDAAPLAVTDAPQFGWRDTGSDFGLQSAYELVVHDGTSTIFDSQKVNSDQQDYVTANGLKLESDHPYTWQVRTWNAKGDVTPYSAPGRFDTGLKDADWHASWIQRPGSTAPGAYDDFSLFRKQVMLPPQTIIRARVYASAGQQYELFVNGRRLAHGPSFSYPDEQYYETTDITTALRPGALNTFQFTTHWTGPGQGRPQSTPALIAHITVDCADGSHKVITTDGTWQTQAGPWIPSTPRNDEGDFVEHIDERHANDAAWAPVKVLGPHPHAPFTHLYAARTHIVYQLMQAPSLKRLPDGNYVADFGAVYAATPVVEIHHGQAGRKVLVRGGYLLDPDGHVSVTKGIQETDMHWDFDERTGAQELRPFGYLGFRYLEIDGAQERLAPQDVMIDARHANMPDEHAASFQTSNKTLNAVWELARHSALYDSQEQFLDTPTREKGPFLGDSFDVSQATMDAFGERNLTWQSLRDFARSQKRCWPDGRVNVVYPNGDGCRDIPDGTEVYPFWVWHAYQLTGNQQLLVDYFPVVDNIAHYVARAIDKKTGLVTNLPGGGSDYLYGAVDWPPQMRYGYDMNTAARTTVNVFGLRDLQIAEQMGSILNRQVSLPEQALQTAITKHLTRPDGIYIDGLEANGKQSTHASQQANAWALAFGLVPKDRIKTVADHIISLGTNTGVVNFRELLDALHNAGRDDALVTQLTDPTRPGYAQMLKEGATFTWEAWDARQTGDSESHGWGSTVLDVLQSDILGVQQTDAGGAHVAITVPNAGLTSASGTVATERGPVAVAWTRTGSDTTLQLTVPPNVSVTLPNNTQLTSGVYALHNYTLPPPPKKSSSSNTWLFVILVVGALVIVGFVVWLLLRRRPA
jgi:alpha-L-rhamnosidase